MKYDVRMPEDLGQVIADRRRVLGKNQAVLANEVGLSRDYLSKLERGRSSLVTNHVFRILRRMGATITISFDDDDAHG